MSESKEAIIVHKNRKRAFGALIIILFFVPISGLLVVLGVQPGRADIGWSMILFGVLGLVTFLGSAILIIRTLRAPWHLEVNPACLVLYTPVYDLEVPWDNIAGIAVDEVSRRPGCVLIFEDVATVAQRAQFHGKATRPDAITNAGLMQTRMEENFERWGYHLGVPGRILEMGPEELAGLLAKARTGKLWREEALP